MSARAAARPSGGRLLCCRLSYLKHRKLEYAVLAVLAFLAAAAASSAAQVPQLKRPAEETVEKPPQPPKKKKVKGPRAVGLLKLTDSGKGTLIPIAILVDGKFYDASAYKAEPVPMALEPGTVYEAEKTGDPGGLFTIASALHSKNPNTPEPWVGSGTYLPPGTKVENDTHKAEDVPVGLSTSGGDEPPRLTRGKPAATGKPASTDKPAQASGVPAGVSVEKPASPAPAASPDKPGTSAKPESSSDKSATPSPAPPDKAAPPISDKSSVQASTPSTPDQGGKQSTAPTPPAQPAAKPQDAPPKPPAQQSDNYYRPTLRRGKPTQSAPAEVDVDEPSPKPGATGSPATTATAAAKNVQLIPAISDEGGPDPRSYKFFWKEGEEDERRKQMLALAAGEVRAYINTRAKSIIAAAPPAAKPAPPGHKTAKPVKPVEPVFENVQFRGFDVWGNNQPVMVLSADAHLPAAAGAASAPDSYSLAVVTRTDIYGDLHKMYSGVTDKFHLDVTPKLELIDAVDVDGDGRGELLFRETSDAGSGYVIYRATADKLWKMFDSLGTK